MGEIYSNAFFYSNPSCSETQYYDIYALVHWFPLLNLRPNPNTVKDVQTRLPTRPKPSEEAQAARPKSLSVQKLVSNNIFSQSLILPWGVSQRSFLTQGIEPLHRTVTY